jgi:hypothetical protein
MAYEALVTGREVTDSLRLDRISVQDPTHYNHARSVKIGNRELISLATLRHYLGEDPTSRSVVRSDWRPLVEEFPGRRETAELEWRT